MPEKKKSKRAFKSTAEKDGIKEGVEREGLRLPWIKFIDALIANGGDQPRAYIEAYPDVKDERVASACATRLLTNANIREELNNKLEAQKVTEDRITNMGIQYAEMGMQDVKMSIAGVKALEMLAKMKGLLVDTKKIAFTGDNPAVFAAPYSAERKAELDKMHAGDGKVPVRIIE